MVGSDKKKKKKSILEMVTLTLPSLGAVRCEQQEQTHTDGQTDGQTDEEFYGQKKKIPLVWSLQVSLPPHPAGEKEDDRAERWESDGQQSELTFQRGGRWGLIDAGCLVF